MNKKGRRPSDYYAPREREVLEVLRSARGRRLTTTEIVDRVYEAGAHPFNARQSILSTLYSLTRKSEERSEKFWIKRSLRRGPRPVSFWLEDRR